MENELWVKDWLIRQNICSVGKDYSDQYFTLSGDELFIEKYLILQQEIARIIPGESMRPTIQLLITSSTWEEANSSYGILGGMGPLSDAQILHEVLHLYHSSSGVKVPFRIHLLSLPPPRTSCELFVKGVLYITRLSLFLQNSFDCVFLASNTAHLHISFFRCLSRSPIVDITEIVTKTISSSNVVVVLILCTLSAHKHRLYESKFESLGLPYRILEPTQRERIQSIINATKEGNYLTSTSSVSKETDPGYELYEIIMKAVRSSECKLKVLLGCTEIPIAIKNYLSLLSQNDVEVINTEVLFAVTISEYILKKRTIY